MKLAKDVLIEIISIVQDGMVNGADVSQRLRDIDLEVAEDGNLKLASVYAEKGNK